MKKTRKLIALLLAFILVLTAFPLLVSATPDPSLPEVRIEQEYVGTFGGDKIFRLVVLARAPGGIDIFDAVISFDHETIFPVSGLTQAPAPIMILPGDIDLFYTSESIVHEAADKLDFQGEFWMISANRTGFFFTAFALFEAGVPNDELAHIFSFYFKVYDNDLSLMDSNTIRLETADAPDSMLVPAGDPSPGFPFPGILIITSGMDFYYWGPNEPDPLGPGGASGIPNTNIEGQYVFGARSATAAHNTGTFTEGTAGSTVVFAVSTEGISAGTHDITVTGLPTGVSLQGTSIIIGTDGTGTITLTGTPAITQSGNHSPTLTFTNLTTAIMELDPTTYALVNIGSAPVSTTFGLAVGAAIPNLVSINNPSAISRTRVQAAAADWGLPTTVSIVVIPADASATANVSWGTPTPAFDPANPAAQMLTFTGTVTLTGGVTNNNSESLTATATVNVPAETLLTLTAPTNVTLSQPVANDGAVIALLPGTANVTTTGVTTSLPIDWSFTGTFNPAPGAQNTFTWSAQLGGILPNAVATSGTIVVTNYTPVITQFTVTFNGNGGTPSTSSVLVNAGGTITVPTANRPGFNFQGWNTAANGTGAWFTNTTVVTANITVFAIWQQIPTTPDETPSDGDGGGGGGGTRPQPPPSLTIPVNNGRLRVNVRLTNSLQTATPALPTTAMRNVILTAYDYTASFDFSELEYVTTVVIPRASLRALGNEDLALEINLPEIDIAFCADTVYYLGQEARTANVSLTIAYHDDVTLTDAQQEALDESDATVMSITLQSGNHQVFENVDGIITVTIPYEAEYPVGVWLLDEYGTLHPLESHFDEKTGLLSFETSELGVFVFDCAIANEYEPAPAPTPIIRIVIDSLGYTLHGVPNVNDVAPFIDPAYDRTMVPLRLIAEALGTKVDFDFSDPYTRLIFITIDDVTVTLTVDVPLPDNMGTPVLRYDRTFVPLRFISEVFQHRVEWCEDARAVAVYAE